MIKCANPICAKHSFLTVQEIKEQYPDWFKKNAGKMSESELEPYRRQHDFINQICGVYEADPSNYEELIRLFQEVLSHCAVHTIGSSCRKVGVLNPLVSTARYKPVGSLQQTLFVQLHLNLVHWMVLLHKGYLFLEHRSASSNDAVHEFL